MPDSTSPKPATDMNLLFGLLALQLDFITKEGLLSAMHTWLLEKQTPLADLLVRNGALAAGRRQLLEALVREHLKQHGDDPQQSLASLSSVDSAKQQLGQLADPDLQASLAPLLSSPVLSMSSTQSVIAKGSVEVTPENTERFRVLRYHAEGGLGQVWVAEDSELHREVALKVIQPKKAHEAAHQTRFVLEAEITGGLEHPGIVPVYGLGHYADGRPFYAMKFIRGDSLKTAITAFHQRFASSAAFDPAAWNLELRKLLQRFLDVCNTVAYAHSRGVLHRDLKPGNVMIGKYGETLVVDWGLAKAVGERVADVTHPDEATLHPATSDSHETASGSAIGTPAYMPPEQAAGRLTELGPHSDVYSLGATLYHLLTNRPPFEGSAMEILDRVIAGGVVPPRERSRRIPVGLSAICVKAMQREASARYASPRDLAQDIERWLADEAITARRDSVATHARRWIRRHQTLSVSMMFLAIGGVAGFFLWARTHEAALLRSSATTGFARAEERLSLRDYVEAARLVNVVQGQLKNRPDLADLAERAKKLSDRVETLARTEQGIQDFHYFSASALRLESAVDPERISEALTNFEKALSIFRVLDRDDWQSIQPFVNVAPDSQPRLAEDIEFLVSIYLEYQHRRGCRGPLTSGLGMQLYQSATAPVRTLRVQRIIPNSPAEKAGIKAGDRILEVSGKSWTEFKDSDSVREAVIGAAGTTVELLIHRPGAKANEHITLIRSSEGRVGIATQLIQAFVVGLVDSGSSAEKAGIQKGDVLFDIDYHPAEGKLHVGESSSWIFPSTGLFKLLRSGSNQRHLTLWRPAERRWHEADIVWSEAAAARVDRMHQGILGLMMREEYGAFLFALKNRSESLLTNLEIDDPDQPITSALEQSFTRRDWPNEFVRQVAVAVTNSIEKDKHLLRALQLQADGKFDDAILELRERARLHQRDVYATRTLIDLLKGLKRWAPLIEITSIAISRRPNYEAFYSTRAKAYLELQVFGLALDDARKALELNPSSENVPKLIQEIEDKSKQQAGAPSSKTGEPAK